MFLVCINLAWRCLISWSQRGQVFLYCLLSVWLFCIASQLRQKCPLFALIQTTKILHSDIFSHKSRELPSFCFTESCLGEQKEQMSLTYSFTANKTSTLISLFSISFFLKNSAFCTHHPPAHAFYPCLSCQAKWGNNYRMLALKVSDFAK